MSAASGWPLAPLDARDVRAARGPKAAVDPFRPVGVWDEAEVVAPGETVVTRVVLLAGAECPYTCAMCDLWRHTLAGATPPGALPLQLREALAVAPGHLGPPRAVKLYNASNFTDPRAVPPADLPGIAALVAGFERVVVETHPRLVDDGLPAFAARLGGRLEVAMGLETADPARLEWLGKRMTVGDFLAAAARLGEWGIDLRVFVLLGFPGTDEETAVRLAVEAVATAVGAGARHVSLVPTRPGNGTLDRIAAEGRFTPVGAACAEAALGRALAVRGRAVVTLDDWDWSRLSGQCDSCRGPRAARIAATNRAQRPIPGLPAPCGCGHGLTDTPCA